jgi:hypothetical protein
MFDEQAAGFMARPQGQSSGLNVSLHSVEWLAGLARGGAWLVWEIGGFERP